MEGIEERNGTKGHDCCSIHRNLMVELRVLQYVHHLSTIDYADRLQRFSFVKMVSCQKRDKLSRKYNESSWIRLSSKGIEEEKGHIIRYRSWTDVHMDPLLTLDFHVWGSYHL